MRRTQRLPLMAALFAWFLPAFAVGASHEGMERPSLNGHVFVSTDLVPEAQLRTYVRNSIGYTLTPEFDYPPVIVRGDTLVTLNGSLAYATLGMEYQNAFRDWLAVRFGFGLRTRVGTQAASLVNEGVNVTSGLDFGWLVHLHEAPKTALSLSLDVTRQTLALINIRKFTEDVIDGSSEPTLIDNVPMVRSHAGLRFAWAMSRPFGLTLLTEGSYGQSPERGDADSWAYDLGASVDFDARETWNVPLGFALAYRESSLPVITETEHGKIHQTLLRVAYTEKPDFLIALDLMGLLDRENVQVKPVWSGGAAFSLRYYF